MQQKKLGVSLVELLIVISIISILFTMLLTSHVPLFSYMYEQITRSRLLRAIHLAQSEAITNRELVFLEKIHPYWQSFLVRTQDRMLYTFDYQDTRGKVYWRAFPLNKPYLQFMRSGLLQAENGTFWYCASYSDKPRWAIVVNKSGRAREVLPDKSGELEGDMSCE